MTDENPLSVYGGLPLDDREFRLLKLLPAPELSAPLIVELCVHSMDQDVPSYDAISYQWGDNVKQERVTVNGTSIPVIYSLYTVLKYLRHESLEKKLWIDGLCIDQDNLSERNRQVRIMGTIFSQADRVRIWLGEASDDSAAAMELVARHAARQHDDSEVVQMILDDQAGGVALTNLLRRPFWQRMWIFQEIVLAAQATVHCGTLEAPWASFRELDRISSDQSWIRTQVREEWVFELRKALFDIAQFCMGPSDASDIVNVLYPTRRMQSTDPRDKLFALVGLCGSAGIDPDYTRSVRDIYIDFMRTFIEANHDFSLILTAGLWNAANGEDINLPSWVPDFRGVNGVDFRYMAASYLKHFRAAGAQTAGFIGHKDGSAQLRGVIVDRVEKVIPLEDGEFGRRKVIEFVEPLCLGSITSPVPKLLWLFRTLVFDDSTLHGGKTELSRSRAKERFGRLVLGFAQDLLLLRDRETPEDVMRAKIADFLESFRAFEQGGLTEPMKTAFNSLSANDPGELHWYRQEYLGRIEETLDNVVSSIFSTQTRGMIGKGPGNVEQGDRLAILLGCRIPVVLRPSGTSFRLVGPCYINGVMHGELMDQVRDGTLDLTIEDIVLI
ncbi:ankyrin and HET domain-containing protein [Xylariales sp. PMI_506]|nr:ankyrin and HET domain-containing protein [Xylariales sp. PMI_506]